MKRADVDKYQRVRSQLEAFHREFEGLTKKAANSTLNAFKLRIVNQAIADANAVLGDAFLPIRGFSQFSDEELPFNSDVSMVLAQYLEALEVFRCRHITQDDDIFKRWYWEVEDAPSQSIPTAPPQMGMSLD
jgi:hypothetical protein